MNFLILNWKDIKNPDKGGAEVIAFEFARRLIREGHSVTFFSRAFKGGVQEETVDGVKIIRKGNKLTTYFHAYEFYKSLKEKPDKVIDMVNTICWQTPLYVPRENRIAYVNQLAREVLFFELPWPLSFISYVVEKLEYLTYKSTRFICYSKSTKDDLISFGISGKNIKTFTLGLDHKRYKRASEKSKNPLFLFVARLVRMKRPDLCIKAMKNVADKYPSTKLLIVGNGPYESQLHKLVENLKMDKNVEFVNKNNFFVDKDKKDLKVGLMQRAWVLLLPSAKEGWGMVVTEAAACGTPSVVSDVTGLRDSVVRDKTGIILDRIPTANELSEAMIKMIENNKLRDEMSKEAVIWAKNFSWDRSFSEFKKLLI